MGLSIRIEVPMREVLLELTRLPVLEVDRLADEDTDGVLVLIDRPMLDLALVVGSGAEEEMDGFLVVIELPMRALLLGLSLTIELLLTEVEPVELLLTDTLDEGLRRLEGGDGLETVIRLETEPPGLLLDEIEPGRLGVDLLIDIPVELLRPGTVRLDEIEVERLGVDLLTDILGGLLLRLGADRLDVIVPERLGVGTLAIDDLLELLRLGVDLLTDIVLELLRLGID